jgi:polar amino acid transport system substrate-binding protein
MQRNGAFSLERSPRWKCHPVENQRDGGWAAHFPFDRDFVREGCMVRALMGLLFTALILVSGLSASGDEPWPDDIRKIKERGTIIVAQYRGVEPVFFFFDDAGKFPNQISHVHEGKRLVGCDIALAARIADELGVRLQLDRSAVDYDSVCRNVAMGKADIGISMLSITLKRAQYLRFSSSYAVVRTGILVDRLYVSKSKGTHNVLELCKRKGTRIGIVEGCSYVDFARGVFPRAHFVYYRNFALMLQGLLKGEILALYEDEFEIMTALHRNPNLALRLRFVLAPGVEDHIAIAVPPRSPNLLAFINILLKLGKVRSEVTRLLKLFKPIKGEVRAEKVLQK